MNTVQNARMMHSALRTEHGVHTSQVTLRRYTKEVHHEVQYLLSYFHIYLKSLCSKLAVMG